MNDSPEDIVNRGIEWLDENAPAEWWDRIDTATLDIADGWNCVLGQVFATDADACGLTSGYIYALYQFFDQADRGPAHDVTMLGFAGFPHPDHVMNVAWSEKIAERRVLVNA